MIHDDGEYLRDPRPFDGHRVLVHRGITQPATAAASATAGSGEGDGKGEGAVAAVEAVARRLAGSTNEVIVDTEIQLPTKRIVVGRMALLSLEEFEALQAEVRRVAELERQRDEVLALHRQRVIRGLDGTEIITDFCAHDDQVMPCATRRIYSREAK